MFAFFKRLLSPGGAGAETSPPDRQLMSQSEIQSLRLELEAKEKIIVRLKADLERERAGAQGQVDSFVRARIQRLMQSAAGPAAQLSLQGHLLEVEGKPVTARDVLAVARNIVRALEMEGLTYDQPPGTHVVFDPNRHEPLSAERPLAAGVAAVVKLPALSLGGTLLRKAGVVPG